jgi:hypothetical protein
MYRRSRQNLSTDKLLVRSAGMLKSLQILFRSQSCGCLCYCISSRKIDLPKLARVTIVSLNINQYLYQFGSKYPKWKIDYRYLFKNDSKQKFSNVRYYSPGKRKLMMMKQLRSNMGILDLLASQPLCPNLLVTSG